MRWVETRAYFGPDRRNARKLRLFDRRKADCSTALPTIQVMLRQLHLRVLDVETAREALAQFELRLNVASATAQAAGQSDVLIHLHSIRDALARTRQKGGALSYGDASEVQERAGAAICALR